MIGLYNKDVTATWSVSNIIFGKIPNRIVGNNKLINSAYSLRVTSLVIAKCELNEP